MRTTRRRGISRGATIAIIVVVVVIIVLAAVLATRRPSTSVSTSTTTPPSVSNTSSTSTSTSTTTSTTTATTFVFGPPNTSQLVDDAGLALIGHVIAPDALDPATGFYVPDAAVFTNVFQNLVEFNGSNYLQVVPVIAENYSTTNYQTYVFQIRPNLTFSNGDPLNAYDVWFSLVREDYMGQSVGLANYGMLTINLTEYSQTGYAFPWGIRHAIQAVTGLPAVTNATIAVHVLNNILSNFNPNNQTIREIMAYPDQAYVASAPLSFTVNLLNPYRGLPARTSRLVGCCSRPSLRGRPRRCSGQHPK